MKLSWAGGVKRKESDGGTGVVEKVDVGTATSITRPSSGPRLARRGVLESGTFVDAEQIDNEPTKRSSRSGRFNLNRDD